MANRGNPMSRRLVFVAFCAFFVMIAGGYVLRSGVAPNVKSGAGSTAEPFIESLASVGGGTGVLFVSSAFDRTNGHVEFGALGSPGTDPYLTRLRCERVHFANSAGLCLSADRGFLTTFSAHIFGPDLRIRSTVRLAGPPSRARVSPDGRRAAMTVFVSGDSYNSTSFSTRTTLLDVETGRVIDDLEEFAVSRSGMPFRAIDFNFWGVTFALDSNRFFATLRSAGRDYLVEGNINNRTARVIREGVECPSLSPDNKSIVFKNRVSQSKWRLYILDLLTLRDRPLSETRNVDDQVEWLDDESIAYALPTQPRDRTGGSDIWTLSVHSQTPPTVLVRRSYSPAAVR